MKLGYVKEKRYWEEGFSSPAAFEDVWKKLYGSFDPGLDVCVIEFQVITSTGDKTRTESYNRKVITP